MSDLKDIEIERLSNLFATGNMSHAREIAQLLGQELKQPEPRRSPLLAMLDHFLAAPRLSISSHVQLRAAGKTPLT